MFNWAKISLAQKFGSIRRFSVQNNVVRDFYFVLIIVSFLHFYFTLIFFYVSSSSRPLFDLTLFFSFSLCHLVFISQFSLLFLLIFSIFCFSIYLFVFYNLNLSFLHLLFLFLPCSCYSNPVCLIPAHFSTFLLKSFFLILCFCFYFSRCTQLFYHLICFFLSFIIYFSLPFSWILTTFFSLKTSNVSLSFYLIDIVIICSAYFIILFQPSSSFLLFFKIHFCKQNFLASTIFLPNFLRCIFLSF